MELNNGIQHNTSIPRNTCNPQNRRYQVDISGSAVDYRQQYYKIETEISLQTFQHAPTYATTRENQQPYHPSLFSLVPSAAILISGCFS